MAAHTHPGNFPRLFEGRGARVYDVVARRVARGLYRRIAEDVAALAPDNGEVLDVGTGPGLVLMEISRSRPDLGLTGLDLSADMVAVAQQNLGAGAEIKVGNVTALPFADNSFDLVVTSLSAHHWDEPRAAAPEIARVLCPGGRFAIYDFSFAPFDEIDAAARDASLFTGQEVRHQRIRSGLLPRCYRHVLTKAG